MLSKLVKTQLALFATVALVAGAVMVFGYIRLPALFGFGHYTVTMELPRAAGLYKSSNVTYRGTEIGRVTRVSLTDSGVEAVLSLRSDVQVSSDLDAQVHSTSAIGEQYVALIPRSGDAPPLRNGDVIPVGSTTVPPDINRLLDAANRGLQAIPQDEIKTVIDESYAAIGGLGPEISRIVKGSTGLAIGARANLDSLVALIEQSRPVLDSQVDTADAVRSWAAHMADITGQLRDNDSAVAGLLENGPAAAAEARQLTERLQPGLPILLGNLVSINQLALTYNPAIEQLLALLPMAVAVMQGGTVANRDSKHPGLVLSFNLNMNLPPPCTTGYLPAQQQRSPSLEDTPERVEDTLYCRIPQDSWMAVRGARNLPCFVGRPGKRAPTAKMCKSDEEYVPLNDGFNWKGDPNATETGQDIPQPPPGTPGSTALPPAAADAPPIAVAFYDPASGSYVGPDGRVYTQSDLASSNGGRTWQSMLTPAPSR